MKQLRLKTIRIKRLIKAIITQKILNKQPQYIQITIK